MYSEATSIAQEDRSKLVRACREVRQVFLVSETRYKPYLHWPSYDQRVLELLAMGNARSSSRTRSFDVSSTTSP
jgi:hypothetical protein